MRGTIKNLVCERGYGFIAAPDADYFFHRSAVIDGPRFDELHVGQTVDFVPDPLALKPRAYQVIAAHIHSKANR